MRSGSWLADVYVFAAQFLGLGSMWFHASIKEWGGITDQLSMFVFAAFIIFYTVRRLWNMPWWAFCLFYAGTIGLATPITAAWSKSFDKASMVMIIIMVAIYLFFEAWMWKRSKKFAMSTRDKLLPAFLWCLAVVAIVSAAIFQILSNTGGPLCHPKDFFQPHGLLWHQLAGVMALLMYFYWRLDEDAAQ